MKYLTGILLCGILTGCIGQVSNDAAQTAAGMCAALNSKLVSVMEYQSVVTANCEADVKIRFNLMKKNENVQASP